ncbi:hypothetical protein ACEE95_10320 [Clostridium baratii]
MKKKLLTLSSIFILLTMFLTGCGSSGSSLSLDTLMSKLQKGDVSDAKNLIIKSDTNDEFKLYDNNIADSDLGKAYYKNVTFNVVKMDKSDKSANAKVKFEYPNMKSLVGKAFKETFENKDISSIDNPKKQLVSKIIDELKSDSFEKDSKEIDITFEKGTDDWLIKDSEDLNDILCNQLNIVQVATNSTEFTLSGVKALKTFDFDWFAKHSPDFESSSLEEIKSIKPYLVKISAKDKIKFNSINVENNNATINISVSTPNIPKLVSENSATLDNSYATTATETNSEETAFKLITDCLNTSKFEMLDNKCDLTTTYNPDDNTVKFDNDSDSGSTFTNYVFGDIDNMNLY